ncbi:hypothetical protein HAX54_030769 [Datura stramonium]|uniref:Uncharacterized protein n=1 Tax=Datura stramonium TaxID=4076 RepID=A0ABS8SBL7_DATST|nr:hypothetical protein [Datura stramonium]
MYLLSTSSLSVNAVSENIAPADIPATPHQVGDPRLDLTCPNDANEEWRKIGREVKKIDLQGGERSKRHSPRLREKPLTNLHVSSDRPAIPHLPSDQNPDPATRQFSRHVRLPFPNVFQDR